MEAFKAQLMLVTIVVLVLLALYLLYSVVAKQGEYDSGIVSGWVSSIVQLPRGHKSPQKRPSPAKTAGKQAMQTGQAIGRPVPGKTPGATPKHMPASETALYCDWELQELDISDLDKHINKMDVPFNGRKKGISIGVADDCEVHLEKSNHSYVSHYHAILYRTSRGTFLKDNGSTNGVYDENMQPVSLLNVGNEEIFYLSPNHAFKLVNKRGCP